MRRNGLWILGLALLLAAAVAGFLVSARLGPERVRALLESRLAEWLGPVEVGPVRLSFAWGIALDVRGLRTPPGPDGEELSADGARLTFDLRRLLRGELRIRRVSISGLRVEAVRTAAGEWRPEALARLGERLALAAGGAPSGEASGGIETLRREADPLPALSIDGGSLRVRTLDAEGGSRDALGMHDVWLRLEHPLLAGAFHLAGAGRVDGQRGGFELAGDLPAKGAPHVELALSDLELAPLAPWLGHVFGASGPPPELAGRTSATLRWSPGAPGVQTLGVELLLFDASLAARLGAREPLRAALPSAHATLAIELAARELRVRSLEWSSGSLHLTGSARAGRPFGDTAPLDVELEGGPIAWPALRDAVRGAAAPDVRRILDAISAGEIDSLAIRSDGARFGEWRALRSAPLAPWPAGLALDADLNGFGIELGASAPIRKLATHLTWSEDRVELRDTHAQLGERPLPGLHLAVAGLRAVIAALRSGRVPDPVPEVPGFAALNDWMELQKKPGQPPKWKTLELDLDWLDHPALLRPLERVHAVLTPADPGFHFELGEAFWGGARLAGRGTVIEGSPGSIDVDLTASLPLRPALKPADAEPWLRGSWRAELEKLGPFLASRASGRLQAVREHAALLDVDAAMRPTGWVKGGVDLDMSQRDSVPYRMTVESESLSLSQLMTDVELDGESATGTVKLGGNLTGHLVPGAKGTRNLADASGPVSGHVRHGEIRRRLNLMMAIAAASDTLNPFRSRDTIPFDKIDTEMRLENGTAHVESMSLVGPATRMVGTGIVDVANEPHEIQGVVALYFFKTLDRVIGVVPIVNKLLLGDDENLVAAYFAVSGPWGDPKASVIPVKTLLAVPTNIVIEGVPAFVRSGISQLEHLISMLPSGEKNEKPEPPPAERAAPPGAAEGAAANAAGRGATP